MKKHFFFLAADPSDPDERAARPEALKCVTGSDDRSVDKSHASFFSISILYLPQNHLKKIQTIATMRKTKYKVLMLLMLMFFLQSTYIKLHFFLSLSLSYCYITFIQCA